MKKKKLLTWYVCRQLLRTLKETCLSGNLGDTVLSAWMQEHCERWDQFIYIHILMIFNIIIYWF